MPPTSPTGQIPAFVTVGTFIPVLVLTVLATVAVGLRIVALRVAERKLTKQTDLWLIIAGLVVAWGDTIEMIVAAAHGGIGKTSLPIERAAVFFGWIEFANVPLNTTAMALVRLSVLQFYKLLFVIRFSRFQWIANTLIALVVAWWFIGFIPAFASLSPSSHFNHETYILAVQGMAIALDCFILSLPVPLIWKIHLPFKRKLKVLAILWLGSSCVVFAGLRYYFLGAPDNRGTSTSGFAYVDGRDADLWGRLEPLAAIIAACLPTYGPLAKSRFVADVLRSARSLRSLRSNSDTATQTKHPLYQDQTKHYASTNEEDTSKARTLSLPLEQDLDAQSIEGRNEPKSTHAMCLEHLNDGASQI